MYAVYSRYCRINKVWNLNEGELVILPPVNDEEGEVVPNWLS